MPPFEAILMLAALQAPSVEAEFGQVRWPVVYPISVDFSATGASGTPTTIPYRIEVSTCTTGTLPVSEPLVELVKTSFEHIQAMAFLPGNEEADEIIERLMARREERQRPLTRRLP